MTHLLLLIMGSRVRVPPRSPMKTGISFILDAWDAGVRGPGDALGTQPCDAGPRKKQFVHQGEKYENRKRRIGRDPRRNRLGTGVPISLPRQKLYRYQNIHCSWIRHLAYGRRHMAIPPKPAGPARSFLP